MAPIGDLAGWGFLVAPLLDILDPQKKYGSLPVRPNSIKALLRGQTFRHVRHEVSTDHIPVALEGREYGRLVPYSLEYALQVKQRMPSPWASSGPCQLLFETREFIADARAKFVPVTTTSKSLPRTQPQLATIYRS